MYLTDFPHMHLILVWACLVLFFLFTDSGFLLPPSLPFLSNAKKIINSVIVTQPECCNCILLGLILLFVILPHHYFPNYFSFLPGLCSGVFIYLFSTEELICSFVLQHRLNSFTFVILFFQVPSFSRCK